MTNTYNHSYPYLEPHGLLGRLHETRNIEMLLVYFEKANAHDKANPYSSPLLVIKSIT